MISPIQQVKYIIRLFDATSKIIISRLRWKCSYINKEVEEQYDKKYMVVFKKALDQHPYAKNWKPLKLICTA